MSGVDYKFKYKELMQKFITSTDTLYRLGYEAGMKDGTTQAQIQSMQQQQVAQQQQMAAMQGQQPGGDPNQPGGDPNQPGGQMPPGGEEVQPGMEQGGEPVDQSQGGMPANIISEEEMGQGGSELDSKIAELEDLLQKGEKPSYVALRKVVSEINLLRKVRAKQQEKVVSSQRKVVESLLKKWETDVKDNKVEKDIEKMIREEGIKLE